MEVLIDGTPCPVIANNKNTIVCQTLPTTHKEPKDIYVGEHGLHRTMYNNTNPRASSGNLAELQDQAKHMIMTSFEIPLATDQWSSYDVMSGFFVAPVTGKYQFFMSGDGAHSLYMSVPECETCEGRRVLQDDEVAEESTEND